MSRLSKDTGRLSPITKTLPGRHDEILRRAVLAERHDPMWKRAPACR